MSSCFLLLLNLFKCYMTSHLAISHFSFLFLLPHFCRYLSFERSFEPETMRSFNTSSLAMLAKLIAVKSDERKFIKTKCLYSIFFVPFIQGIEIRYSAHSAFTITSIVIFKNVSKIVLLRDEMPCKDWRLKKLTTFASGQFPTISGHFLAKYINIFQKLRF